MKILFLDIDSVMTVHDWTKADPPRDKFDMLPFTKECVKALNEIISKTGCRIVLSSDHRNDHSLETLNAIFKHNGCIEGPISITPNSTAYTADNLDDGRAQEIIMWLDEADIEVENWVAVDDLLLDKNDFLKEFFIETQSGIHVVKEKIIKKLNL